jgi:hypothetical protein
VHDLNGSIQPNGLFWTVDVPRGAFSFHADGERADLRVSGLPLVDSFVFGGTTIVPATSSVLVRWRATEPALPRGLGDEVGPTDAAAFLGEFAPARATGAFEGRQLGFAFRSRPGTNSDQGYAEIGTERNGSFL